MTFHLDHYLQLVGIGSIYDVMLERIAQEKTWGRQDHSPEKWLLILSEELGEWSQAVLDAENKGAPKQHIRDELVQVAAVALAMVECGDRNGWHK